MVEKNNEDIRQKLLKKLKSFEMMIGCTTEDLLTALAMEIGARLPQSPVNIDELAVKVAKLLPDANALSEKIRIAVESKMAGKLDEVMATVSKGMDQNKIDPQSIIAGVAALLQPQIVEAAKTAGEAVFQANSKALIENINKVMEQRFQELAAVESVTPSEVTTGTERAAAGVRPGGPSMAGTLLQMATTNPEGLKGLADTIKSIIEIFKPAAPAGGALNEFNKYMMFHDLMTKIEKRTATPDEIQKGVQSVFTGTPSPPTG